MSDCAAVRASVKLVPPPIRFDTTLVKSSSGELVKSFEMQVVVEWSNKIMLYASLRATAAFCPTALTAAWREVQNPWSDENTAPSLLLLYRVILAVDGVFWRGRRSPELMEPDLWQISIPTTWRRVGVPVDHKDAGALLEASETWIQSTLGRTHGRLASKLPGFYTQIRAHRWRRSPIL